ncbi:hypothetical protein HMN09_00126300 [Mycena chlorophos]|uniref:Glycosyl transferase CAP10 domain-containing protein n=1 Tax=Mycena chlorophos TaxID=658473 RepID=A0A8H6WSW0_MYCCL|nr:hypothetical protein HMN09_00126300 [Mycena chlorophos]
MAIGVLLKLHIKARCWATDKSQIRQLEGDDAFCSAELLCVLDRGRRLPVCGGKLICGCEFVPGRDHHQDGRLTMNRALRLAFLRRTPDRLHGSARRYLTGRMLCRYGLLAVLLVTVCAILFSNRTAHDVNLSLSSYETPAQITTAPTDPWAAAAFATRKVQELRDRQSKTLEQATERYTAKTGRSPPPGYDRWLRHAREKGCLIDEYERVWMDFEPFWRVAEKDPRRFAELVGRAKEFVGVDFFFFSGWVEAYCVSAKIRKDPRGMTVVSVDRALVKMVGGASTAYDNDIPRMLRKVAEFLPDMEFILNGRDEPRVVFNYHDQATMQRALELREAAPFRVAPKSTLDFFESQSGCLPWTARKGFTNDSSEDVAFFVSSSNTDFTTDLWPVLSMAKISPCFSDILFPASYYHSTSWFASKFRYPNEVAWEDKKAQIYWRGTSTGGRIYGDNYRRFPRFKLLDLKREHPELVDARLTRFDYSHCGEGCDKRKIIREYHIRGPEDPNTDIYRFKYLLDVDGNTFSGRFLGLLRSGSLVFKARVLASDWLQPFQHFIPVRADLADLVQQVHWAMEHENEARAIMERGRVFAEQVLTDEQNECYFALVLLEWARLYSTETPP